MGSMYLFFPIELNQLWHCKYHCLIHSIISVVAFIQRQLITLTINDYLLSYHSLSKSSTLFFSFWANLPRQSYALYFISFSWGRFWIFMMPILQEFFIFIFVISQLFLRMNQEVIFHINVTCALIISMLFCIVFF